MTDEEIASMLEHGNKSGKPGKGVSFDDFYRLMKKKVRRRHQSDHSLFTARPACRRCRSLGARRPSPRLSGALGCSQRDARRRRLKDSQQFSLRVATLVLVLERTLPPCQPCELVSGLVWAYVVDRILSSVCPVY